MSAPEKKTPTTTVPAKGHNGKETPKTAPKPIIGNHETAKEAKNAEVVKQREALAADKLAAKEEKSAEDNAQKHHHEILTPEYETEDQNPHAAM
jgi:hypothetical protein